ncbi:hypothetical protein AB6D11_00490 [Vibrio splendidus]
MSYTDLLIHADDTAERWNLIGGNVPTTDTAQLYAQLNHEEAKELFCLGLLKDERTEVADALGDLLYTAPYWARCLNIDWVCKMSNVDQSLLSEGFYVLAQRLVLSTLPIEKEYPNYLPPEWEATRPSAPDADAFFSALAAVFTIAQTMYNLELIHEIVSLSNFSKFPLSSNVNAQEECLMIVQEGRYEGIRWENISSQNKDYTVFRATYDAQDNVQLSLPGKIIKPSTFKAVDPQELLPACLG